MPIKSIICSNIKIMKILIFHLIQIHNKIPHFQIISILDFYLYVKLILVTLRLFSYTLIHVTYQR